MYRVILLFLGAVLLASCTFSQPPAESAEPTAIPTNAVVFIPKPATDVPSADSPILVTIKEQHWVDETGRVPAEILDKLDEISSRGTISVYGIFVPDNTQARVTELSAERGLNYPNPTWAAVTMAVKLDDRGKRDGTCYQVSQYAIMGTVEGAYYNQDIENDDSLEALVRWVDTFTSGAVLQIGFLPDIPADLRTTAGLATDGVWKYVPHGEPDTKPQQKDAAVELTVSVLPSSIMPSWSRHVVLVKGDESPSWIELRYFDGDTARQVVRLYPNNLYHFDDGAISASCTVCNGEWQYAIDVFPGR